MTPRWAWLLTEIHKDVAAKERTRWQQPMSLAVPKKRLSRPELLTDPHSGRNDPYNRVAMTSFSTTTTAYQLINKLATLRQNNGVLAYGSFQQRWINNDVYINERRFFNDVVLVTINKNDSAAYPISGLYTALPAGTYADYLSGLLSGMSLTVQAGNGINNPAASFTLPAHTVAVWQSFGTASSPEVGSIGPTVGQPGLQVTIAGKGFGPGPVRFCSGPPRRPSNPGPIPRS
jgi:hypothetical protein